MRIHMKSSVCAQPFIAYAHLNKNEIGRRKLPLLWHCVLHVAPGDSFLKENGTAWATGYCSWHLEQFSKLRKCIAYLRNSNTYASFISLENTANGR